MRRRHLGLHLPLWGLPCARRAHLAVGVAAHELEPHWKGWVGGRVLGGGRHLPQRWKGVHSSWRGHPAVAAPGKAPLAPAWRPCPLRAVGGGALPQRDKGERALTRPAHGGWGGLRRGGALLLHVGRRHRGVAKIFLSRAAAVCVCARCLSSPCAPHGTRSRELGGALCRAGRGGSGRRWQSKCRRSGLETMGKRVQTN